MQRLQEVYTNTNLSQWAFFSSQKAEYPYSFDADMQAIIMQLPPPGPPQHLGHFLEWVYRQQTLWPGLLNFNRSEIKQIFYMVSTQWLKSWQ